MTQQNAGALLPRVRTSCFRPRRLSRDIYGRGGAFACFESLSGIGPALRLVRTSGLVPACRPPLLLTRGAVGCLIFLLRALHGLLKKTPRRQRKEGKGGGTPRAGSGGLPNEMGDWLLPRAQSSQPSAERCDQPVLATTRERDAFRLKAWVCRAFF